MRGFDLPAYLADRRARVDDALDRALPADDVPPTTIHRAMRYSVFAGGKRLRPILVIAGAESVGPGRATRMATPWAHPII